MASVVAALAIGPGVASATAAQTQITTPANGAYLESYDNPPNPTMVTVNGTAASGINVVDIVCYYASPPSSQYKTLIAGVPVSNGAFTISPPLRPIAGHACRLRAVPSGDESTGDSDSYAGPLVAVSEAALPSADISDGPNAGMPYNFYVNGTTFTAFAGWNAAGGCGPFAAPLDSSFGMGNFAINCAGSLLGDNLPSGGTRSEVQVDGRDAYDAASAESLFPRTNGEDNGSEDLSGFPSLAATANWDPSTGLMSSVSNEGWVVCPPGTSYPPNIATCPSFAPAGVSLQRDIGMSDGGQVITMTDTWSSTDGAAHTIDLLYDDVVGLTTGSLSGDQRGYEFPGQSGFSSYSAGATVSGPSTGPGSILVRTNVNAPDGDTSEGAAAITFSTPPSAFEFAGPNEFEEHDVIQVAPHKSVSLTYIYSVGYTVAGAEAMALAAQDQIEPPAIAIALPVAGTTVTSSAATVTGTANSGSGIASLLVNGTPVAVGSNGAWSSQVALSPGANTITAVATDAAGQTVQSQTSVVYQAPAGTTPAPVCHVPRIKGMKLPAAEKAIRAAHCKVGKVKKQRSSKIRAGRAIGTSPPAGRKLRAGWKIELFVSTGRRA